MNASPLEALLTVLRTPRGRLFYRLGRAVLILSPEGLGALAAAIPNNQVQRAMNLFFGRCWRRFH